MNNSSGCFTIDDHEEESLKISKKLNSWKYSQKIINLKKNKKESLPVKLLKDSYKNR